jgi:hypothetical protein
VSARADRLLGERQSITVSKKFRAAKKKLGIISRRDGFGRGGEWFWELPTTSKTKAIETALDPAAKKAAMVVYAETHSRPDDHDQLPDHGRDDGLQGDPPSESGSEALLVSTSPEHRELACPTRVPSGSARKSAAIIPFVNKTLTHGLPIASTPGRLTTSTCWPQLSPRRSATNRSATSGVLPAEESAMICIGLLG